MNSWCNGCIHSTLNTVCPYSKIKMLLTNPPQYVCENYNVMNPYISSNKEHEVPLRWVVIMVVLLQLAKNSISKDLQDAIDSYIKNEINESELIEVIKRKELNKDGNNNQD